MTRDQQVGATPLWRRLQAVGNELGGDWRPVSASPELRTPTEPATTGEAKILEEGGFSVRDVGAVESSGFEYFLDGVERARVCGYIGIVPLVHGYVAAVIRQRADRSFRTWRAAEQEVLAFPHRLMSADRLADLGLPTDRLLDSDSDDGELHPLRLAESGRLAVKRRREHLEARLAREWADETATGDGWLLVDGRLAIEPAIASSGRAIGLVKSHRTQFLDPTAMRDVLAMDAGQRSPVFRPIRPEIGEVYSWYLRLRSGSDQDIYWGLARIEGRAAPQTLEAADQVSRWLLHETRPIALPDPRWDVLLYPVRDCEQYLKARMPTLSVG